MGEGRGYRALRTGVCLLGVLFGWGAGLAGAQASAASTANAVLLAMGRQAAVIFAGTVESVTRADAAGYVDVRFRVEQGIRGAHDGGIYVLREWAGLWTGGAVRYGVGQHRLMLLTGRGPSGMSAPVGGTEGAVPLFGAADGTVRVDLRWVRAQALRGVVSESQESSEGGLTAQAHEDPFRQDWAGPVAPMPGGGPAGAAEEPSLAAVIALLGGLGGM